MEKFRLQTEIPRQYPTPESERVAEEEQYHPDLHLTGYKHVLVELSTHAIDGLSDNDLIVAAKIDSTE